MKRFQFIIKKSADERIDSYIHGKKVSFISGFFRCWHGRLSRPFVDENFVYRSCLKCGARRPYNPKTLSNYGSFYYPSVKDKTED